VANLLVGNGQPFG